MSKPKLYHVLQRISSDLRKGAELIKADSIEPGGELVMLDMKDTCSSLNVRNPCKETWFFMEEQLLEEKKGLQMET